MFEFRFISDGPHGAKMKLSLLNQNGISQIDQAAKSILNRTGVDIPHKKMRQLFREAGARIGSGSNRIFIPETLVNSCLDSAGKVFTLYGRDREKKALFGCGKRNYNSVAGEAYWVGSDGKRTFATLDNVRQAARLGEVLPKLTIVGAMSDPHEIDVAYRCVEVAATQLRTTTKPITFWFHDRASAVYLVELFSLITGSMEELARYPLAYPFLEPISPLRFPEHGIDLLFETAKVPLPVPIGPMAQVGLTAPATLDAIELQTDAMARSVSQPAPNQQLKPKQQQQKATPALQYSSSNR